MQITEMAQSSREIFFFPQFASEVSALRFQLSFKRLQERRKGSTNSCILKIENAENILDSIWVKYKVLFKSLRSSFPH